MAKGMCWMCGSYTTKKSGKFKNAYQCDYCSKKKKAFDEMMNG